MTWTHRFTTRLSVVVSAVSLFDGLRYDSETRTPFISSAAMTNKAAARSACR